MDIHWTLADCADNAALLFDMADADDALGVVDFDFAEARKDRLTKEKRSPLAFDYTGTDIAERGTAKFDALEVDNGTLNHIAAGSHIAGTPHNVGFGQITILEHEGGLDRGDGNIVGPGVENHVQRQTVDGTFHLANTIFASERNLARNNTSYRCFWLCDCVLTDGVLFHETAVFLHVSDVVEVAVVLHVDNIAVACFKGLLQITDSLFLLAHDGIDTGGIIEVLLTIGGEQGVDDFDGLGVVAEIEVGILGTCVGTFDSVETEDLFKIVAGVLIVALQFVKHTTVQVGTRSGIRRFGGSWRRRDGM